MLGVPLSWQKGAVHDGATPYTWIGVRFSVVSPGVARMTLPGAFVQEVLALCATFLSERRTPSRVPGVGFVMLIVYSAIRAAPAVGGCEAERRARGR